MNEKESAGCRDILQNLSDYDLASLKETVTKKQISTSGRAECIDAIVTYSESAEEFLKRRKLRRDVLFQYLVEKHVVVSVNSEKQELITAILRFWNSHNTKLLPERSHNSQKQNQAASASVQSEITTHSTNQLNQSLSTPNTHNSATGAGHINYTVNVSYNVGTIVSGDNCTNKPPVDQSSVSGNQSEQNQVGLSQKIGETFASWFYKILNSHNPTTPETPEDFGPHHFWPDASFKMLCKTTQELEEEFSGAEMTSQRLLALVKDEQLLFNPNITQEGIVVKSNPHGQVVVMVCGTIHRVDSCLGEFEQLFGLLRDPRFDNNWKVKFSKLRIRSSQVTEMPKLTDQAVNEVVALVPV